MVVGWQMFLFQLWIHVTRRADCGEKQIWIWILNKWQPAGLSSSFVKVVSVTSTLSWGLSSSANVLIAFVKIVLTTPHHNRFMAIFPGPPGWAGARRELLHFMVQGKINRGRHTDYPAGRHSIRTNQCPPPPSPHIFYRPDALPAAQLTASKHWRSY